MFIAKCIQDGRRVDLPLSRPFFKLLCTLSAGSSASSDSPVSTTEASGPETRQERSDSASAPETGQERSDSNSPCNDDPSCTSTENSENSYHANNPEEQADSSAHSNQRTRPQTPHPINSGSGIWSEGAGLKEAEVLLSDEIPKDRSCKNDVLTLQELGENEIAGLTDGPWFAGILDQTDLREINPYQGKFLKQLEKVVAQKEAIERDESLSVREKEHLLKEVTLPGEQENLPGTKLENLWCVVFLKVIALNSMVSVFRLSVLLCIIIGDTV